MIFGDIIHSRQHCYSRERTILDAAAGIRCAWPMHSRRNTLRGLLEKYPTFGREKETGLLGALDT